MSGKKIQVDISAIQKIEYKDLKTDFLSIGQKYIDEIITPDLLTKIYQEYKSLFIHFDLEDLQFIIEKDDCKLKFKPIREIDKYAIVGIMACEV